jgi:BASS family bile acid:Na+ symporter
MFGLDGNLALVFTLTAIGLHPVATPAFTGLMTDGAAGLTATELALRLTGLIGAAGLASLVLRRLIPRQAIQRGGTVFDATHIIIMLVFAVALMDGITARIIAEPLFALQLIALSFALHILINIMSFFVLRVLAGVKSAATLAYCNGGRNIAIAMSVLGSSAPDDAWLFFAMLQFPIYILPMLMQPVYRRLLPQPS